MTAGLMKKSNVVHGAKDLYTTLLKVLVRLERKDYKYEI